MLEKKDLGGFRRRSAGLLLWHPAPYLYPALQQFEAAGLANLEVWYQRSEDGGHPQWKFEHTKMTERYLSPREGRRANSSIWALWSKLWRNDYDVVLVSGYNNLTTLGTISVALLRKIPCVLVLDSIEHHRPWYKRVARTIPLKLLFRFMAAFWVPGSASREYLQAFGVSGDRIFEGCYCLNTDELARVAREEEGDRVGLREALGFSPGEFIFLMAARLIPTRNVLTLIDAFAEALKRHPGMGLMIVGDGPQRSIAQARAKEHNLDRIRFFSQVDFKELERFYAACDAFVMPSEEAFSLAVVQAAIFGIPILSSAAVGSGRDYVIDGETGYTHPSKSWLKLAAGMVALASDRPACRKMGAKVQSIARQRNAKWAAEQLEAAIEKACE
jgi:glycosyltransferase involved in cell wall biosynthesis